MRWAGAAALPLLLAACGQGDSGNVMAPNANAVPPALVDLALGPENASATANETEPANAVTPADSTEVDEPAPAPRAERVEAPSSEEPADASAEEESPAANNSVDE